MLLSFNRPGGVRTPGSRLKRAILYLLSYEPVILRHARAVTPKGSPALTCYGVASTTIPIFPTHIIHVYLERSLFQ
jgi:hypothetical protein